MDLPGIQRLKLLVAREGRRMTILLAVLGVFALGGAGYVSANPATTSVVEEAHPQAVSSSVTTSAVVTGNTTLYERGQVLEDQPVYLDRATPTVRLDATASLPAATRTASHRLVLVYRARSGESVFWQSSRVLARGSTDGSQLQSRVTLNVSQVRNRVRSVQDAVAGAGVVDVRVRHVVRYRTDRYEGTLNASAPLSLRGRSYALDTSALSAERRHTTPVTRAEPVDYHAELLGGLVGTSIGFFVSAAAIWSIRRSVPDPARIRHDIQRRRYDEWISEGDLMLATGTQQIMVDSLADLVNIGIDSNRRVIHDANQNRFAVLVDGVMYYYDADNLGEWNRSAWNWAVNGDEDEQPTDATPPDDEPFEWMESPDQPVDEPPTESN
jgi:hypothetical protein